MRIASSAFLRRAASMSSSYNRRGSPRPHRGYSSRPSPPPAYAAAGPVSGDSHLGAVHAANDSLRRGGGARAPQAQYRHGPRFQPPPPPPPPPYGYGYGQPQQPVPVYGCVPYNYSHHQHPPPSPQYGNGTPNQYGRWHPQPYGGVPPNAGFRPRASQLPPRLAEYHRRWRFAQKQPPHQAERFKVLSYNILADYLAQEHQDLYENIPSFILDWNWRKNKIVFEIGLWHPDILCLQEVDKFTDLEQEMATRGFSGIWKMRTGNAADGCAIFWRTARFQLRYEEDIEFNKLGLRDNVAQLCVLESVVPRYVQSESIHLATSPSQPQQAKQVVICNIHVLYNPKRGDIKLGQVRTLLDRAYTISKMWNDAPVILCGDFNATPKSPLYNFISEQKLNLSGLARYAISGQQTSSLRGLYTGSNTSRYEFRPPFHMTNGREGRTIPPDSRKPQSEARNLVRDSCLAGRETVLTGAALGSDFNSESSKSFGYTIPCSGSTNLDEQVLLNSLEAPAKDACNSDAEAHAKATDSSETVDSRHLLSSYESSGGKDFVEELRGVSSKDSNAQRDLSGDVISEDVACGFEGSSVQSDALLDVSKDNPHEKQKGNESMSSQNNCTTSQSESSHFSDPLNFADALHKMSNMRLEEESNTGPTNLISPVEPVHQSHCAISDSCGNQCIPEVMNKHSDSYSCPDKFGNHAHAFEDDPSVNEILCSDVNSDPNFYKEFSGDNECLHIDEDQLPTISNGSPFAQKVVTSYGRYYNDQYRWTADEIKAATGSEECTYVEHKLKVRSVYTDVEDFEGTKDANKEPLVTSYNRKFMGTVDYIWASEDLQTVDVLDTFPKEILKQTIGFPTKKWGSDHIALVCELAFTK